MICIHLVLSMQLSHITKFLYWNKKLCKSNLSLILPQRKFYAFKQIKIMRFPSRIVWNLKHSCQNRQESSSISFSVVSRILELRTWISRSLWNTYSWKINSKFLSLIFKLYSRSLYIFIFILVNFNRLFQK